MQRSLPRRLEQTGFRARVDDIGDAGDIGDMARAACRREGVKKFGSDIPDVAIHLIERGTR